MKMLPFPAPPMFDKFAKVGNFAPVPLFLSTQGQSPSPCGRAGYRVPSGRGVVAVGVRVFKELG